MSITIRPSLCPDREVNLTPALTAAVAHELWKHGGGNDVVNWLEAERIVSLLTLRTAHREAGRAGGRHASERLARRKEPDRVSGPIPYL